MLNSNFNNQLAGSHNKSQNYWMAELGLTSEYDQRFRVLLAEAEDDTTVLILDEAQVGVAKTLYSFSFSSHEAAVAFGKMMQAEVGTWDVEGYYTAENAQQDAVRSYEAANSGMMV